MRVKFFQHDENAIFAMSSHLPARLSDYGDPRDLERAGEIHAGGSYQDGTTQRMVDEAIQGDRCLCGRELDINGRCDDCEQLFENEDD